MCYKLLNAKQKGNGDSPKMKHKKILLACEVVGSSTQDFIPNVSKMAEIVVVLVRDGPAYLNDTCDN